MTSPQPRETVTPMRRLLQLSLAGLAAAVIAACGGGGGVGAGGTGSAAGTVNGFGSVIVNGVRYDDSSASITGDDSTDGSKLRIGMSVEIETDGNCGASATTCVAQSFIHDTALAGPISAAPSGGASVTVLGQTVNITATTNIYPAGTTLAVGQVVKVHGRRLTTGAFNATYVEVKSQPLNASFKYRLTGPLVVASGVTTIGGELVDVSTLATPVPASGTMVRALLNVPSSATTRPANGWVVNTLKTRADKAKALRDRLRVDIEGAVAGVATTANGKTFNIDGVDVLVPATGVTFEGVTFAGLVDDVLVEVKGLVNANGVLVATKVEAGADESEREFHVLASEISGKDTTAKTFVVTKRSAEPITVYYGGVGVLIAPVTEANLGTLKLEIKGEIDRATGKLNATRIKRED